MSYASGPVYPYPINGFGADCVCVRAPCNCAGTPPTPEMPPVAMVPCTTGSVPFVPRPMVQCVPTDPCYPPWLEGVYARGMGGADVLHVAIAKNVVSRRTGEIVGLTRGITPTVPVFVYEDGAPAPGGLNGFGDISAWNYPTFHTLDANEVYVVRLRCTGLPTLPELQVVHIAELQLGARAYVLALDTNYFVEDSALAPNGATIIQGSAKLNIMKALEH